MIKASELRVGNKIKRISNGNTCTVNWGIIKDADFGDAKDYEYITMMPDILEKCCCFVRLNDTFWWTLTTDIIVIGWNFATKSVFIEKDKNYIEYTKFSRNILPSEYNSLHQLQNLYFALTGQELEINL